MKNLPHPLIISADDFGLHSSINRAIYKAHKNGVLTHTSIVSQGPAFEGAVDMAKELRTLSTGVHLTLPGNVRGKGQIGLLGECLYYAIRRLALKNAWRRQIKQVMEHGITPSHLDSHQHTHFFPGVFRVILELAEEFNIGRVRWLVFPHETTNQRKAGALILKSLQACSLMIHRRSISNVQLVPSIGFETSGRLNIEIMMKLIKIASDKYRGRSVEIFCHPGDNNAVLEGDFGWSYDWESELTALCDSAVKARITHLDRNTQSEHKDTQPIVDNR